MFEFVAPGSFRRERRLQVMRRALGRRAFRAAIGGWQVHTGSITMSLAPGTKLGGYHVVSAIGSGGMGEVYRGRDARLKRDVALKVLPEVFAGDRERLARFQREAEILASLNHANIAVIHGLEQLEGVTALVLELVEGPTLAERIAQGPISLEEAVPIATQIAAALETAHEAGVIHRDLKPANVKVRPDGVVKVLDFGLGKALGAGSAAIGRSSPTVSSASTQMGVILGTAAYMAPEQAKGMPVDKRADIWSFGCVLYEMLTGSRAFQGTTISEVLANVLSVDIAWDRLPENTPHHVLHLLQRCLRRDPMHRLRDIGDARLELTETRPASRPTDTTIAAESDHRWKRPILLSISAALLLFVAVITGWSLRSQTEGRTPTVSRFVIGAHDGSPAPSLARRGNALAVSPDGRYLVYVAGNQLYLRAMEQLGGRVLPGTDSPSHPFFSPDGRWVGFFSGAALRRVVLSGGNPLTVAEVGDNLYRGATWTLTDRIIFGGLTTGLMIVPAAGGVPEALTELDGNAGEIAHRWPEMLPGHSSLLFTVISGAAVGGLENSRLAVLSLKSGKRRILLHEEGYNARYASTGHLLFARDGAIMAAPFDLNRLEITGAPIRVVDHVQFRAAGAADFAFSGNGVMAYIPLQPHSMKGRLVWIDREGNELSVVGEFEDPQEFSLSPDGTRVAIRLGGVANHDVWIVDLAHDVSARLTSDAVVEQGLVWTPDGGRVAFGGQDAPLSWKAADGTGSVEVLAEGFVRFPQVFSADGTRLVFQQGAFGANTDLGMLVLDGQGSMTLLLDTPFAEQNAVLSPDGRFIAYETDESGRLEVVVRPFPEVDRGRWQVSGGGGRWPLWNPDSRELFYVDGRNHLIAVATENAPPFRVSAAAALFDLSEYDTSFGSRRIAVSRDGQRFLLLKAAESAKSQTPEAARIDVVVNWFEELTQVMSRR